MPIDKKFYELDETEHVEDGDLFALGRGLSPDGTMSIQAYKLRAYFGSGAFNGNRPVTVNVPGLFGVNTGATNVADFLEALFFPAVAPVVTLSVDNPIREKGDTTAYTLSWSVTKKSRPVTSILVDGQSFVPSGSAFQSGTKTGNTIGSDGVYTKFAQASDDIINGTASLAITFVFRLFFGATENVVVTSDDVRNLTGSQLQNNKQFTINSGIEDTNMTFAIPSIMSVLNVNDQDALNIDLTSNYVMTVMDVADLGGILRSYKVYRYNQAIPYTTNHRHNVIVQ